MHFRICALEFGISFVITIVLKISGLGNFGSLLSAANLWKAHFWSSPCPFWQLVNFNQITGMGQEQFLKQHTNNNKCILYATILTSYTSNFLQLYTFAYISAYNWLDTWTFNQFSDNGKPTNILFHTVLRCIEYFKNI